MAPARTPGGSRQGGCIILALVAPRIARLRTRWRWEWSSPPGKPGSSRNSPTSIRPLVAGLWETAAEMGAKVLLWQVQQQGTDALNSRILDEQHFEFRGGWYRGTETELRTRASDPAFNGPT